MRTALITGAGGMLGSAFARACIKKGYCLWLIDNSQELLDKIRTELQEDNNAYRSIIAENVDLSDTDQVMSLVNRIGKSSDLELVINNAALPTKSAFTDSSLAYEMDMVRVNSIAPLAIIHAAVEQFKQANTAGKIINVCSLAGLLHGYSGVTYTATKHFLVALSRRLSAELKAVTPGIYIQALCPGIIDTPFEGKKEEKVPGPLMLTAEKVVQESFASIVSSSSICVPGKAYKLGLLLSKFRLLNIYVKLLYLLMRFGIVRAYRF